MAQTQLCPPWNSETARIAALKSWEGRRANALPGPATRKPRLPPEEPRYVRDSLAMVRKQLALVSKRILEESAKPDLDARAISHLCMAQDKLAELERKLAGRPLPGSRRPSEERAPRARAPLLSQTKLSSLQTPQPPAPGSIATQPASTDTPTTPQPGTQ